MTSTTYIRKLLIIETTRIMQVNILWMVCALWTRQSFRVSKCQPVTYLVLYHPSLSLSDYMARTYLSAILFSPSKSSALRTALKVPLITRSYVSAYLASFTLGTFALGSFGWMISVYGLCCGLASRVSSCLVALRYPRKSYAFEIGFLFL